jgi:hypothetical protein
MQIKTIQKTIQNKINEWLESITDETLRKAVKENLLVSGGSITSMLLNIDINDYDIYIKDMDVLLKLVQYYAKPFSIEVLDGRQKQGYLDSLRKQYNIPIENELNGAYVVAIKSLKDDQIKIYVEKSGGIKVNEDKSEDELLKYIPLFFSPNAISLSNKIQIVCRFHGDAEAIHKTFDFIHATNYFTFENGLVTNIKALESIITKQLYYQGSFYPLTSIIRMKKFIKRNWNINAGEILKIMFQISELDLHDPEVLEDQLIGVDVAYFNLLIDILRGIEPTSLTSAYLNTIIDRVFNSAEDEPIDKE